MGRRRDVADGRSTVTTVMTQTGDPSERFPRLNVAFERLLGRSVAPVLSMVPVAESPSTPAVVARGIEPVHGDRALLAARLSELVAGGYSVTVCAEGAGSASRLANVLAEEGMVVPVVDAEDRRRQRGAGPTCRAPACGSWWPRSSGAWWCRRPRWPSWPRPTSPDAVVPIVPPGPGPGPPTGSSTTWPRATTSSIASTAWPATRAW